jgi:hypothetical protein
MATQKVLHHSPALTSASGMFLATDFRRCQSIFSTPFTVMAPVSITININTDFTSKTVLWDQTTRLPYAYSIGSGSVSRLVSSPTTVRSQTVFSTGTVWAEPVSVYWQSSDLSLFPSAYATSLASAMNVPFLSATSPTSSTLPTRTPEALSVGAKAGIGVGAFFGVAIIAGALVFVSLRRRKRQKSMQHPDLPEMNGQDSGFKRMFAGKWRAEVDGSSKPVEIDSRNVMVMPGSPVELEGSQGTRFETLRRP